MNGCHVPCTHQPDALSVNPAIGIRSEKMPEIGEIKQGQSIGKTIWKSHIWHACLDCGKGRWVILKKGKPANLRCHTCARQRQVGVNHPNWKGGRVKEHYGYVYIKLQPGDFFYPMATKKGMGYVLEHRLVMAKSLNRCLLPWEVVHHRNGDRDDNRLDNLELLPMQGKHNTILNKEVKRQAKQIKELQARVTLLEAELVLAIAKKFHDKKVVTGVKFYNEPIIAVRAR